MQMSFIIENKRTKGESYNAEKNTSQIVSKYMISLKFPLSQLPINNCTNHYKNKTELDI